MASRSALILGLGNLLMGDEGVGVHALRALRDARWPDGVALVDGASGTFHLLARLQDFRRLIVIEGVEDGAPAGTVAFVPLDPEHLPRMLERHDVGLRDLVESAALLGPLPEIELLSVSIGPSRELSMHLSPPVAAAIPRVREALQLRLERTVAS
mgnify:CR=1 FL=1